MANRFGLPSEKDREYARPERLADVIALIQVLALGEKPYRSEDGLVAELQGAPLSSKAWTQVAGAHPEFFRVKPAGKNRTSLVARHVLANATQNGSGGVGELSPEFTGGLLQAAIDMHDRQVRRAERWTYLVPIWVALVAGIAAVVGTGLRTV